MLKRSRLFILIAIFGLTLACGDPEKDLPPGQGTLTPGKNSNNTPGGQNNNNRPPNDGQSDGQSDAQSDGQNHNDGQSDAQSDIINPTDPCFAFSCAPHGECLLDSRNQPYCLCAYNYVAVDKSCISRYQLFEDAQAAGDAAKLALFWENYDGPVREGDTILFVTMAQPNEDIYLASPLTSWHPTQDKMITAFNNNYRYIKKNYPRNEKLYYKYVANSATNWYADPDNPYVDFTATDNQDGNSFSLPLNSSRIMRLDVPSNMGEKTREILVWLPAAYFSGHERLGVLYMQDGDNIFKGNPKAGYGTWDVDETLENLINAKEIAPLIVVGITTQNREAEYLHCNINNSDLLPRLTEYTTYVISTLKPVIDKKFRTKSDPLHTAIDGSSLGGLSAFRIAWQHPNIFGKVAAFSPSSWVGSLDDERTQLSDESLEDLVNKTTSKPNLKIYLDNGTIYNADDAEENYSADAWIYTDHLRNALVAKGFDVRQEWLQEGADALENLSLGANPAKIKELYWSETLPAGYSSYDEYLRPDLNLCHLVGRRQGHNEASWKARFAHAMRYLYAAQ